LATPPVRSRSTVRTTTSAIITAATRASVTVPRLAHAARPRLPTTSTPMRVASAGSCSDTALHAVAAATATTCPTMAAQWSWTSQERLTFPEWV
jgi:hypothetical protein